MLDDAEVEVLLARIDGWAGRARVAGSLDGGITNHNLLVDVDGDRFVLRLSGSHTELLGIDRPTELEATRRAMVLGFGPEVVTFLEPEQYLVTRFVVGRPVPQDELATPEVLGQVAHALRAFHATAPLGHRFDAFRVPFQHRDAAAAHGVPIPPGFDAAASVTAAIERAWLVHPDPACPCHDDLLNANLLRKPDGRLVLLDWEYAGTNDRYFDLGNLATNNGLDREAGDELVRAYFGAVTPRRRARLALMRILSDFREAMWAVVQQAISDLDVDFVDYAARHLDRMLSHAGARDLARVLADATLPEEPRA